MTEPEDIRTHARRSGETTAHREEGTLPPADAGSIGQAKRGDQPQLPHERDESASSQASGTEQQKVVGQQAYADTLGPGTDTDRGPVLDAIYNDDIASRDDDVPPRR